MINTYSASKDGEIFLSEHFKVKEFRPRRFGVPDGDEIKIDSRLIERLELLSGCVNNAPIIVTDGYRTISFDIELTGKAGQHTKGCAADIYVSGYSSEELAALAELCDFDGVGIINSNAIHVDTRGIKKRFIEKGVISGSERVVDSFVERCGCIHTVKIPKSSIKRIAFQEIRESPKKYQEKFSYDYLINGGFFYNYKNPTFKFVSGGDIIATYPDHSWGIGVKEDGKLFFGNMDQTKFRHFLSAHPVLVENGVGQDMSYAKELCQNNPRSAIGYNDLYVFLTAVDGRKKNFKGFTLNALRQYMKYIGTTHAVNLDGGGSSFLASKDKVLNSSYDGRDVNNIIAIMLK